MRHPTTTCLLSLGTSVSFARVALPLALLAAGTSLWACQVPVFRYALERWHADRYHIIVLHDEPLSSEQNQALKPLRKVSQGSTGDFAIELQVISVDQDRAAPYRSVWKRHANGKPCILVYYPVANAVPQQAPFFVTDVSPKSVATILNSPLRQKITERLAGGDSAVWIFVPCGRKKDDQNARERLKKQLAADTKWLELPTATELEVKEEVLAQAKIPLRIGFTILTLKRNDARERFLLQALLRSEDDLVDFQEPLAFPVFGQGRVLYCLVGEGIAPQTIRTASSFIAGPCSCQVKNQNPGFDLLLQADWKTKLGEVLISEPIDKPDDDVSEPTLLTIPPGRKK